MIGRNSMYNLFTRDEIPNYNERVAVNCFKATESPCNNGMRSRCRVNNKEQHSVCPLQTKKEYKK